MLSSVLFILILLSIQYTPTYVYRLIRMNVADVYDYKNFENQEIQGAKSTNTFISQPKEKYVESLFEELVTKTGFNSFENGLLSLKHCPYCYKKRYDHL